MKIVEITKRHGRVTASESARATETSRNTIKDYLKALIDRGYLIRHGAGRGIWYSVK